MNKLLQCLGSSKHCIHVFYSNYVQHFFWKWCIYVQNQQVHRFSCPHEVTTPIRLQLNSAAGPKRRRKSKFGWSWVSSKCSIDINNWFHFLYSTIEVAGTPKWVWCRITLSLAWTCIQVIFPNNIKGILAAPPKATPPRNKGLIRPY